MEIQGDFSELLELLNANQVEYLIVGGFALALYGSPRFTGDIDILVKPDFENATRIVKVLNDFGFGAIGLNVDDFTNPDNVVQLGYPPIRIDFLTSLTGVSIDEAFSGQLRGKLGNVEVSYIGREQFMKNKRALGRAQDFADLEAISE